MNARRRPLRFENLENRALLSADLVNGVLTVVGTKKADTILVDVPAVGLHVGELAVDVNGVQTFFNVADVSSVKIFGLGGNDQITINDVVAIDAWISGGNGNDNIKGGGGNDTIHGDNSNDTIHGSLGDDELFGDNGGDSLDGGDGNDFLDGGNAKDVCHGGLGDDLLKGGHGNDRLDGDAGNNLLDGDSGKDQELNGVAVDLDADFKANLIGIGNLSGKARLESECEHGQINTKFELEVRNLAANTSYNVIIDGVTVGQLVTDNSGKGELEFVSNPSGGETGFPIGFPAIDAGSTITVGSALAGSFVKAHGPH